MSPTLHLPRAAILAANLVVTVAMVSPACAGETSAWDGDQRAAVRLIAGAPRGSGAASIHHAGVEVHLAPGWKTYWRYPGDSGVPPRFDFSGSRNLKSASVRYPAPHRLTDESGTSIGYKGDVVFPLDVTPQDAGKPVDNHGELPDGTKVDGALSLKAALMERKDLFIRNLTTKMLGYALGRGLTLADSCTVDRIVDELKQNDYKAQKLVELVILSVPFQYQPPAARPKGAKQ